MVGMNHMRVTRYGVRKREEGELSPNLTGNVKNFMKKEDKI